MFDMEKTGRKISELRKKSGMTQMALADKLGISFQAVSNWERGLTMPDVAKLPEIAELFGVTIEELLGGGKNAEVIEKIANDVSPDDISAEVLADIAPIIPQDKFEEAFEKSSGSGKIDLKDLLALAPFLEEKTIDEKLAEYVEKGGVTLKDLMPLMPFASDKKINELADKCINGSTAEDLVALAPFLDDKKVDELAFKLCEKEDEKAMHSLVPFMTEKGVALLVEKMSDGKDLSKIIAFAPLMDDKDLATLAKSFIENGGTVRELLPLMPFLPDNFLKTLI